LVGQGGQIAMKLQDHIDTYIGHFRTEAKRVRRLRTDLYCKVLVATMLDALACGRYPNEKGNRVRFVKLVEEYLAWPHARLISASQLLMNIEKRGGPGACGVSDEFVKRLRGGDWRRNRNSSDIDGIGTDPTVDDLSPTTKEEKALVNEFRHSQRFYRYRCTLVHEHRKPGHGMEWGRRHKAPYYHSMSDSKGKKRWLELVYPTGWFLDLVPPVLKSLETYYTDNAINPYDSYEFGSPWR
jgi:hypothetical protein